VACDDSADTVEISADDGAVIVSEDDADAEPREDAGGDGNGSDDASHEREAFLEASVPESDANAPRADGGTPAFDAGEFPAQEDSGLDAAPSASDAAPDAAPSASDAALAGDAAPTATSDTGVAQLPPDAALVRDSGPAVCTPNCTGRSCGDNGCAGSCGSCTSGSCSAQGTCICTPSCTGRTCGSDGCAGTCGDCASGQSCSGSGQCSWPARAFAADVYPIFQVAGCPDCHDASSPSAGLNLSSASAAHENLVGADAGECTPTRKLAVPLSPETSYLINKLTGTGMCSGVRMPRNRPALTNAEIDLVRAWIGSGAAF
jgi:hypothetical protein